MAVLPGSGYLNQLLSRNRFSKGMEHKAHGLGHRCQGRVHCCANNLDRNNEYVESNVLLVDIIISYPTKLCIKFAPYLL